MFQVLLYYKYVDIEDPKKLLEDQKALCEKLNLKGRIIVASEGINGTVEGTLENTEKYIKVMTNAKNPRLHPWGVNLDFKKSLGTGKAFPKLSIKLRDDIVSQAIKDLSLNPTQVTGKYISPEQLHEWIHSNSPRSAGGAGKEFYIVDMRNDYETDVGYFKNSILPGLQNFRDLPKVLPILNSLKGKTIVTVCTGGVRCEKASGFLIQNGFNDVYQLLGGIVSYIEKYPNEDFLGSLYVFDGRITMGFNRTDPQHVVVGKCKFCSSPAEKYFDCKNIFCQGKRHFIACEGCIKENQGFCSKGCVEGDAVQENELFQFQGH